MRRAMAVDVGGIKLAAGVVNEAGEVACGVGRGSPMTKDLSDVSPTSWQRG